MNIRFYSILLFCLFCYGINAQTEWFKNFGSSHSSYHLTRTQIDNQGNIYSVGKDESIQFENNTPIQGFFLTKMDSLGRVIWQKKWASFDAAITVADFKRNVNGDLFLLLIYKNTITVFGQEVPLRDSTNVGDQGSDGETAVVRLNADGEVKWAKRMPYLRFSQGQGAFLGADAIGNAYIYWTTYDGGEGFTERYLTKLNASDGTLEWGKMLTKEHGVTVRAMVTDHLGNTYLGGSIFADSAKLNDNYYPLQNPVCWFKLNPNGEVEWIKSPQSSSGTTAEWGSIGVNYNGLTLSSDGSKLYLAGKCVGQTVFSNNIKSGDNEDFIAKVSTSDGEIDWANSVSSGGSFFKIHSEGGQTWAQLQKIYNATVFMVMDNGQRLAIPTVGSNQAVYQHFLIPINEITGGFKPFSLFTDNTVLANIHSFNSRFIVSSPGYGRVYGQDSTYLLTEKGFFIHSFPKEMTNIKPEIKINAITTSGICGSQPIKLNITAAKMRNGNKFTFYQVPSDTIQRYSGGGFQLKIARQLDTISYSFNSLFQTKSFNTRLKVQVCSTSPLGCSEPIEIIPPKILNQHDTLCYLDTLHLKADIGLDYLWSPSRFVQNAKAQFNIVKPDTSVLFKLSAKAQIGCTRNDSVLIYVARPLFDLPDTVKLTCNDFDDHFRLTAHILGGLYSPQLQDMVYSWTHPASDYSFESVNNYQAVKDVYPTKNGIYTVKIRDRYFGCSFYDTTHLILDPCKILIGKTTDGKATNIEIYQRTNNLNANSKLLKKVLSNEVGNYIVRIPFINDSIVARFISDYSAAMFYDSTLFIQQAQTLNFNNNDTLVLNRAPWAISSGDPLSSFSGYVFDYYQPNEPIKNLDLVFVDSTYFSHKKRYGAYPNFITAGYAKTDSLGRFNFKLLTFAGQYGIYGSRMDLKIDPLLSPKVQTMFQSSIDNIIIYKKDSLLIACEGLNCGIVRGSLFVDANANCTPDASETRLSNAILQINPGNILLSADNAGMYAIRLKAGTYTVKTTPPQYFNENCSTNNTNTAVVDVQGSSVDKNFGYRPIPNINDISTELTAATAFRPGFNVELSLDVYNKGTVSAPVVVTFKYPESISDIKSVPNFTSNNNQILTWNIPSLAVGEKKTYQLQCRINPDVNLLGRNLVFESKVTPSNNQGDYNLLDNTDTVSQIVTGAYDPNDKQVTPRGLFVRNQVIPTVDDYEFQIRFQNTGTDTAFTVVVRDTLDNVWNPASLRILSASHKYQFNLIDNKIGVWTFNNILLVDSFRNEPKSHGYIKFALKPKISPLVVGDVLKNKAHIYFDFNPPIVTNEVLLNVVKSLSTSLPIQETSNWIHVYPNPTNGNLNIELSKDIKNGFIEIKNLVGQVLRREQIQNNLKVLNLDGLQDGLYYMNVIDNGKMESIKFVLCR
jgi:Secretion system C-terminal sorting domain/Domain of unknown function DUF11